MTNYPRSFFKSRNSPLCTPPWDRPRWIDPTLPNENYGIGQDPGAYYCPKRPPVFMPTDKMPGDLVLSMGKFEVVK